MPRGLSPSFIERNLPANSSLNYEGRSDEHKTITKDKVLCKSAPNLNYSYNVAAGFNDQSRTFSSTFNLDDSQLFDSYISLYHASNESSLNDEGVLSLISILKEEQNRKRELNSLVTNLQGKYDSLLVKYAEAETHIDKMRFRSNSCDHRASEISYGTDEPDCGYKNGISTVNLSELPPGADLGSLDEFAQRGSLDKYFTLPDLKAFDVGSQKASPSDFRVDSGFQGSEISDRSVENAPMYKKKTREDNDEDSSSYVSQTDTTKLNPNFFALPDCRAKKIGRAHVKYKSDETTNQEGSHDSVLLRESSLYKPKKNYYSSSCEESAELLKGIKTSTPKNGFYVDEPKSVASRHNRKEYEQTVVNVYCNSKDKEGNDHRRRSRKSANRRSRKSISTLPEADYQSIEKYLDQLSLEANAVKRRSADLLSSLESEFKSYSLNTS